MKATPLRALALLLFTTSGSLWADEAPKLSPPAPPAVAENATPPPTVPPPMALPGSAPGTTVPQDLAAARQEAGIPQYNAPSIDQLFTYLNTLQPLPFDLLWQAPPDRPSQDRVELALSIGASLADGFLVVAGERVQKVEPLARALLRSAKALGIADKLLAQGRSIVDKAKKERWNEVRRELMRSQAQAEAALLALQDDDLVQLVSLGGWLRGLQITATSVAERYTVERSRLLLQPELATHFLQAMPGLKQRAVKSECLPLLETTLREIEATVATWKKAGGDPSFDDVVRLRNLTEKAYAAIIPTP